MILWAVGDVFASWLAVAALVAALIVTVTDNGLGFTATAELAGPFWAGRALGVQNTGQNIAAMAAAPLFGALDHRVRLPGGAAASRPCSRRSGRC